VRQRGLGRQDSQRQRVACGQPRETGASVGLDELFACAWFDRVFPPSADHQRMQLLFEK
jgi:hypothetical protein